MIDFFCDNHTIEHSNWVTCVTLYILYIVADTISGFTAFIIVITN